MASVASLAVSVDSRSARTAQKDLEGLSQSGAGAEKSISGLAKSFLAFAGVTTMLAGARRGLRAVAEEGKLLETNMLKTEQLIKSTGRAAETSFNDMHKAARDMARGTLESTENIMQAQQILMTFRNVGTESFDAVTEMALNLSQVTGTSLTGSMNQLAKVLDDPVRNLSALSRAGVSFSAAQTDLIKNLAETNRLAEAQGVIMQVLESQYGGVARAAALGLAGAQDSLAQAFQEARLAINEQFSITDRLAEGYNALAIRVNRFNEALEAGEYDQAISNMSIILGTVGGLAAAFTAYRAALLTVVVAKKAATVATLLLNAALRANPIGIVVTALAALAGALFGARNRTLELGGTTATVGDYMKAAWDQVSGSVDWALDLVREFANFISGGLSASFNFVLKIIKEWFNFQISGYMALSRTVGIFARFFVDQFKGAFENVLNIGKGFWQSLMAVFSGDLAFTAFREALTQGLLEPSQQMAREVAEAWSDAFSTDHIGQGIEQLGELLHVSTRTIREQAAASYEARNRAEELAGATNELTGVLSDQAGVLTGEVIPAYGDAGKTLDDYYSTLRRLQYRFADDSQSAMMRYEDVLREIDELEALRLLHYADDQEAQSKILEEHNELRLAAYQEYAEAVAKIESDLTRQQAEESARRLAQIHSNAQTMADLFGGMAAVAKEAGAKQFAAYKAFATGQAIISSALAVSKALASSPPPFNFIAATAAGLKGAAQVMAIQRQQPPVQRRFGGSVNPGDEVLVGEAGPEIIRMGNQGGHVVPNHKLGGGETISVTNVYQISTGVAETVQAEVMALAPQLAEMSKGAVLQAMRQGGPMSRAARLRT